MEIIYDRKIIRSAIERSIEMYGFAPEHNINWFFDYTDQEQEPIIACWPDNSVIMLHAQPGIWYTFSEPLASIESRGEKLAEFSKFVFRTEKIDKIVTEAGEDTKKQFLNSIADNKELAVNFNDGYTLIWPIMDMTTFDPNLPGGHFKYLRNAKNKFYREYNVEIKEIAQVDPQELRRVVDRWVPIAKEREGEFMHEMPYYNLIDTNFEGMDAARAMVVDGNVVGFNAGWKIPHSDTFYGAIGIHDYSVKDLGLMLYLEDLLWIKNAGYPLADMGGVEEGNPLNFKNQFLPTGRYKTHVFSIVRNKQNI